MSFCITMHNVSTYLFHTTGRVGADTKLSSSKNSIYKLATIAEIGEPIAAPFFMFIEVHPVAEFG